MQNTLNGSAGNYPPPVNEREARFIAMLAVSQDELIKGLVNRSYYKEFERLGVAGFQNAMKYVNLRLPVSEFVLPHGSMIRLSSQNLGVDGCYIEEKDGPTFPCVEMRVIEVVEIKPKYAIVMLENGLKAAIPTAYLPAIPDVSESNDTRETVRTDIRERVRAAIDGARKQITFESAAKSLKGKIDLDSTLESALEDHQRWGVVSYLIEHGIISDREDYRRLFGEITFSMTELRKLTRALDKGEKLLPVFDPGLMTPSQMFSVLFPTGVVINANDGFLTRMGKLFGPGGSSGVIDPYLSSLKKIEPSMVPNLEDLVLKNSRSSKKHVTALRSAWEQTDLIELTGPSLHFTADTTNSPSRRVSSSKDLLSIDKTGNTFMDPCADMLRIRTQIDAALFDEIGIGNRISESEYRDVLDTAIESGAIGEFMPDSETHTRYPNYVFSDGRIPYIYYNPELGRYIISTMSPSCTLGGSRPTLY